MRRMLMLFAAVALLALSLAPVVQAQGKGQEKGQGGAPEDASFELLIKANDKRFPGTCDFPVLVEATGDVKTIELPNGTTLFVFPGLEATLTNQLTGTSETFSVTGANRVLEPNAEGVVVTEVTGNNLLIDPLAGFVVASGNFSFSFDAEGNLVQPLEGEGQLTDVCAALA